jgi:ATP-binding cassette subfamily B protein
MLVGPGIMYTANTIVFTAGALVFMLSISPRLTLFAFAPLPIFSIVVQYFGRRIHERFERIQAMFSDISARAQENFSGARLIRAYVQEEAEIESFETDNKEYIARSLKLVRLMGMLWPTLETLLGFAIIIVLYVGGREVLQHRIGLGSFVAFNTYMMQLTWPIIALGWVINIFQRGTASMGRIHNILSEQPEITDVGVVASGAPSSSPDFGEREGLTEIHGDIEFRNLHFHYGNTIKAAEQDNGRKHGDDDVLKKVNLQPGHRWTYGSGQVDAGLADSAHLRRRGGDGTDRRPTDSRISTGATAKEHRLRAAGDVPLQRHHPREHRLRRRKRNSRRCAPGRRSRQHRRRHRVLPRRL